MSKCISFAGEYSDHQFDETVSTEFECARCFVFDQDAASEALVEARAEVASLGRAVAGWEAAYAALEQEYLRAVAVAAAAHDDLARIVRAKDERNRNA